MDIVSVNIIRNGQYPIILRKYLFELHTLHDPCLLAIYDNTKELIHHIDQIFAQSIQTIKKIKPLDNPNFNKGWTFQLRSCPDGKNSKGMTFGEILRKKPIYKEFILINQEPNDDKYEQEKFQQWNQYLLDNTSFDQQDTDIETDSDIDDAQVSFEDGEMSSSSGQKLNESKLWPLTTINNPAMCTIDEDDINLNDVEQKSKNKKRRKKDQTISIDPDLLIDRYHSTQKMTRENFDNNQYLSDDERQVQSPYSPDHVW